MASESHEIKIKDCNIKKIFETMEYGNITENINLAKAWLKKNRPVNVGTIPVDLNAFVSEKKDTLGWKNMPSLEKCFIMERFAKEIEKNATLICQLEILVRGILGNDTKTKALPLLIDFIQYYVHWPTRITKDCGGIAFSPIDDCCFLGMLGSVLGPALAAGYNIVFHAEPKISVVLSLLLQLGENAGIPKGTLTLTTGGINFELMFKLVDVTSFPGNLHSLKFKEIQIASDKKIIGVAKGKAPMIVFNNGDLDSTCDSVIDAAWGYGGILPWNLDTILVQEDVFEEFTNKLKYRLSKVKIGSAFDKLADIAYPEAEDAFEKLQKTLLTAKSYGIEIFQKDPLSEQFQPTILIGGNVSVNNVILEDDDSFVVCVIPFRTTIEAVNLANNRRSGIGASVWTENIGLANEVAKKLNFSNIWINSFGNISPITPFSPYKESGIGFIGGEEGIYEYLHYIPKINVRKEFTDIDVQDKLLQSFYGGSFKKSESGLQDGIFEVPIAKDLFNAVEAARKGFEAWKKETLFTRSQILRRLALEMNQKKQFISVNSGIPERIINNWIELTYEAFSHLSNTGNVTQNKCISVQTVKEPLGIVAINETNEIEHSFLCIITTLILGNSVIVLNYDKCFAKFYVEICKILNLLKFPSGVFNVILNSNEDVVKSLALHKELIAYFILEYNGNVVTGQNKIKNFKQVNVPINDWCHALYSTKIKNVWSNIGDSVV